jgi:hypothetical protein
MITPVLILLEGFGDFEIGQVMHSVNYADDLVLLAKEEAMLQNTPLPATSFRIHHSIILL